MTLLTLMTKDPVPPGTQFDTAPISPPAPGTQLVTTLQWNNLIDLLQGTSVDEIDLDALEVLTINRAVETNAAGHLIASAITNTELNHLSGLVQNVETNLNLKELSANKGAVSGYAGLDASQLLLLANFPAGTGDQFLKRNAGNTALEFAAVPDPSIDSLTDTTITAAAAHEVLVRNAGNTAWVNELIDNLNLASGVFANITGLGVQSQVLDMGAQGISNAGLLNLKIDNTTANLELEANHTTPSAAQDIGRIDFIDDNSIGTRTIYATIISEIEDPTSTSEDSSMSFWLESAGSLVSWIEMNKNLDNQISFFRNLNMGTNDVNDVGQITFQNITMDIDGSGASFLDYTVGPNEWHFFRGNSGDPIVSMGGSAGALNMAMTAVFMEAQGSDVASVAAMTLGFDGNYYNITGTTNISTISSANFDNGAIIKLKFDGALTITHGTSANQVNFADNQNYTTVAGDVITLVRDLAVWVEVSRSRQGISTLTSNLDAAEFDIINVGLFNVKTDNATAIVELEANHTVPAIGQIIGQVDFYDDDSGGARTLYARISSTIEDDTTPTEDGSITFEAVQNGSLLNFMTINDNAGTAINIKRPFIFESIGAGITNNSQHIANLNNVMIFNVQTAESYEFRVQGANEYDYDATRADFNSNNIINLGTLNTHTIPAGAAQLVDLSTAQALTNKTLGTGTIFSVIPTINDGIKFTFNPNATVAGLNVGAHTADASAPVNGDVIYNSTSNTFKFRENGAWAELNGGGEFLGPMTAAHDYAGFNIEFKTANPITLGQGATDLLSVTFLDDTVDAGMRIGNTDGFIEFSNKSAVVGDNQMELLMESGGATTIQNIMKFTVPVADDSGTEPVLSMTFEDAAGGALTRPLMTIDHLTTELVRLHPSTLWTFHTSTILEDINTINFNGVLNTDLTPATFTGVSVALAENEAITWDGAAAATPNSIGFSAGDVFIVNINNAQKFQISATQANFLGGIINGVAEYQFQTGTGSIEGVANGVIIDSPTQTDFEIGGATKFFMNASFLDMGGLHIKNISSIRGDEAGTPEVLTFTTVTSAVNEVNLLNAIAASNPVISAQGTDTNIHLQLQGKGTEGAVFIDDHLILNDNIQQFKGTDIAAAANFAPRNGNFFDVTGATQINYMVDELYFQAGSIVTLQFDSNPIIQHNTATPPTNFAPILLKGDIDYQTAAGDTLTIVFDGVSWVEIGRSTIQTPGFTMVDGEDIVLGTTTGTKIGTATSQKLAFFNSTPVVQPTALTTVLTTLTSAGPGTPDYAIQAATSTTPFGFVTADEMETVLTVIINNQARIADLESKLQALGLLA